MILPEPPELQNLGQVGNRAVVEAPFALLDGQVEVLLQNAIEAPEMAFCLVPEVLDTVDVVYFVSEQLRAVDAD